MTTDVYTPALCSSCHAPIIWATSASTGKPMPVDRDPTDDGNVSLTPALFPGGTPEAAVSRTPVAGGRRSHFQTCPHALAWRQKRATRRP